MNHKKNTNRIPATFSRQIVTKKGFKISKRQRFNVYDAQYVPVNTNDQQQ